MIHRTSGSINVFSYTTCERRLVHDVLRRSRLDSLWKCTTSTQISGWRSWTLRSCAVKKPQRKIHLCSSFWNWVNFCQRRQPFRWPRKIKENSSLQFFWNWVNFRQRRRPFRCPRKIIVIVIVTVGQIVNCVSPFILSYRHCQSKSH